MDKIFGKINPPTGTFGANPAADLGRLIGIGVNIFLIIVGVASLIYLLRGAFQWTTSAGDKEKLQKAQQMLRNAVIGVIITVVVLMLFNVIFGIVLGGKIIQSTPGGGFQFNLPQL